MKIVDLIKLEKDTSRFCPHCLQTLKCPYEENKRIISCVKDPRNPIWYPASEIEPCLIADWKECPLNEGEGDG